MTSEKRSLSGSSLSAAVSIRDSREREKKEICDLNDRFANYIEKVRFLDAQNRKMMNDLEVFRARVGKDTMSTKAMFECEISVGFSFVLYIVIMFFVYLFLFTFLLLLPYLIFYKIKVRYKYIQLFT
ncbi:unnamed protein product [Anisakis simplex]|uniref:IF rod domain-containing protein n=1 Tax=Anisakis simplex TaxID=6269 RepID=A0A3P6PE34_ANISI|nr:unnamed protein product [Anisakis simplex]